MKTQLTFIPFLLLGLTATAYSQSTPAPAQATTPTTQQVAPLKPLPAMQGQSQTAVPSQTGVPAQTQGRSPGGDIGSGSGDIGKGAAGGAGHIAAGTGKGAVDLVTLHPIDAAGNVGKGAAIGGKDVAEGTTKGTGKVVKGIGRGIKHIF